MTKSPQPDRRHARNVLLRLIEVLGLRRSVVGLLSVVVLVGLGERLAERFLPVYLGALGGGAILIGLAQGLNNLLGAVYSYPGGYLADRLGPRRSLLLFNFLALMGFTLAAAVAHWAAVIGGSVLFLAWSAVSMPATMNLLSAVLPRTKRTMGLSVYALVRRVPMAVGPVLGGLLITIWGAITGVRLAFGFAAVMAVAAMVFQYHMIAPDPPSARRAAVGGSSPRQLLRDMSPALRGLLVADVLIRFCEQIPYAFVVVWCMELIAEPVSAVDFGFLTAVEMAAAMLSYIPAAFYADRLGKRPFVIATFGFFTLFPLALLGGQSFGPLVAVFVLRGFKEFGEPSRKALIAELSPADRQGTMFGFYYFVRDTVVSVAALGGGVLWAVSPRLNLLAAVGCGLAGTIWFAVRGQDATSRRPAR